MVQKFQPGTSKTRKRSGNHSAATLCCKSKIYLFNDYVPASNAVGSTYHCRISFSETETDRQNAKLVTNC